LINLHYPFGAALTNEAQIDKPGFRQVLATRRPFIGNLNPGPVSKLPGIAVRLPVMQDEVLRYVLEFIVEPSALGKLMQAQKYPASWVAGLVDRNGLFIARQPTRISGAHASRDFWAAVQ